MINQVALTGRVTKDAEPFDLPNGQHSVNFTLAVNRRKAKDGSERTAFVECQLWGNRAMNLAPHLRKGLLAGVTGHIETYATNNNGQKRYYTKVVVDDFVFLDSLQSRDRRSHTTQVDLTDDNTTPDPFASPDAFAKTGVAVDISDDNLPF